MKATNRLLWAVVVLMLISLILLITTIRTHNVPEAVCHAVTEDSVITDCDYHDGAWWTK